MKKLAVLTCLVVFALGAGGAMADDVDYQLRIMVHRLAPVQPVVGDKENKKSGSGFAGWAIVPDVTARPARGLLVAGRGWRDQKGGDKKNPPTHVRWVEVMGGSYFSKNGFEPMLNARSFAKNPRGDVYAETLYNFRTRRLLVSGSVTTPVPFLSKLRIGAETDLLAGGNEKVKDRKPSFGIGPRVVVPVPFTHGRVALTTGFQLRTRGQPPFIRSYLTINW